MKVQVFINKIKLYAGYKIQFEDRDGKILTLDKIQASDRANIITIVLKESNLK